MINTTFKKNILKTSDIKIGKIYSLLPRSKMTVESLVIFEEATTAGWLRNNLNACEIREGSSAAFITAKKCLLNKGVDVPVRFCNNDNYYFIDSMKYPSLWDVSVEDIKIMKETLINNQQLILKQLEVIDCQLKYLNQCHE